MIKYPRIAISFCTALWALALMFTALAASSQVPVVSEIVKVADVAREKDVVWLALMTTIVAVLFSAWLVWKGFAQNEKLINALLESAKAYQGLANSINELREDLGKE